MKKIMILLAMAFGMSTWGQAQERKVEKTVRMDTINVDYKTRYISNSFWDNFYVEGAFSGRMLLGSEDSHLSFGERLKPGFNIAIGKQFHPDFGVRLGFGGMRLDGWNNGPTGLYYHSGVWEQGFDPVEEYWKGQGVDTRNGYKQEIKYFQVNADFMFDLYNIFTDQNRFNRRWSAEGFVGLSWLRAMDYHGMENNNKVGLRLGVIGHYRLTPRLGLNLQVSTDFTDSNFDGELGKGTRFCNILAASVGLRWQISRNQGFRVVRLMPQSQIDALNQVISTVRRETTVEGDTIMRERQGVGTLLIPSVVFYPGKSEYNEELQELNIFRMARYLMRYKDIKVAVVGNTGGVSEALARRRAEVIRDRLVNKYGIFAERLVIRTYDVNAKYNVKGYEESVSFVVAE